MLQLSNELFDEKPENWFPFWNWLKWLEVAVIFFRYVNGVDI